MRMTKAIPNLLAPLLRLRLEFRRPVVHMASAPATAPFALRRSNPPGLWSAPRLTQVVEVQGARMIYLSGQTPADEHYKVHATGVRAQAHAVYDNIEIALKAAGATLADVIKTTTYLTSADYIDPSREVRVERYKNLKAPPANTLLIVSRLAEPGMLIEIELVAAVAAKSPQEAQEFKGWLMSIARGAAEAAKEGGFLGFGGTQVSEKEMSALSQLSAALGVRV